MTKLLIDINIFMDVLQRRGGWTDCLEVINRVHHREVEGWISALTVPIVYIYAYVIPVRNKLELMLQR